MPQPLSDLPEIVRAILDDADVDLDNYDGCRYTDRGNHFFVALYPEDGLGEDQVLDDAERVEQAGTPSGVGTRGWLLLPKVDKPGGIDPDIKGQEMGGEPD